MQSIIEGFNYDIFISCQQKYNKGDRWVSEFVEALKIELESSGGQGHRFFHLKHRDFEGKKE